MFHCSPDAYLAYLDRDLGHNPDPQPLATDDAFNAPGTSALGWIIAAVYGLMFAAAMMM